MFPSFVRSVKLRKKEAAARYSSSCDSRSSFFADADRCTPPASNSVFRDLPTRKVSQSPVHPCAFMTSSVRLTALYSSALELSPCTNLVNSSHTDCAMDT
eukprot:scaffold346_cov347-Pavlova_lutheri.AAC.12